MGGAGVVVQANVGTQRTYKIKALLLVHLTEQSTLLGKFAEKGQDSVGLVLSVQI